MKNVIQKMLAVVLSVVLCLPLMVSVPVSADSVTWMCGDVNNDGTVSLADVTSFNKYLNGMVDLVDYSKADTNADCVVDLVDRMILSKYISRVITALPYTAEGGGSSYATVGAASVNSGMGYTIFDATTGAYASSYYLDANPIQDNSRDVIGEDDRYGHDALNGVVKIIKDDTTFDTGFVVDAHTIATAAHCVFSYGSGTFQNANKVIDKILILDNNGVIEMEITGMYEIHVPNAYISSANEAKRCYDYALITVTEDLSDYICFDLGIMTDGMMQDSEKVYSTGFPKKANDVYVNDAIDLHQKFTGEGYITSESELGTAARRFCHTTNTYSGNSGGPVYVVKEYNGTTYNTVIGIHTRADNQKNQGIQMTTELLHFYKNNPNISWGE